MREEGKLGSRQEDGEPQMRKAVGAALQCDPT